MLVIVSVEYSISVKGDTYEKNNINGCFVSWRFVCWGEYGEMRVYKNIYSSK